MVSYRLLSCSSDDTIMWFSGEIEKSPFCLCLPDVCRLHLKDAKNSENRMSTEADNHTKSKSSSDEDTQQRDTGPKGKRTVGVRAGDSNIIFYIMLHCHLL